MMIIYFLYVNIGGEIFNSIVILINFYKEFYVLKELSIKKKFLKIFI